jgi:HAD superfamily hydrolase (TIGR01509 family)
MSLPLRASRAPSRRGGTASGPAEPAPRLSLDSESQVQALLWDIDGTLAETERDGHRVAFNRAFEEHGLPWRWDDAHYGRLLAVAGGRERLLHDLARRPEAAAIDREALAATLHRRKNALYAELVREGAIALRSGVRALIDAATARGLKQAIVTTTSTTNAAALLGSAFGPHWRERFDACICGEDVQRKKPDPEAYRLALQRLSLQPLQALAIEDSPGGAAAARAAGVPVVVTRSVYFADAPIDEAVAIGPGLHTRDGWQPPCGAGRGGVTLDDLLQWHAQMALVSDYP